MVVSSPEYGTGSCRQYFDMRDGTCKTDVIEFVYVDVGDMGYNMWGVCRRAAHALKKALRAYVNRE